MFLRLKREKENMMGKYIKRKNERQGEMEKMGNRKRYKRTENVRNTDERESQRETN